MLYEAMHIAQYSQHQRHQQQQQKSNDIKVKNHANATAGKHHQKTQHVSKVSTNNVTTGTGTIPVPAPASAPVTLINPLVRRLTEQLPRTGSFVVGQKLRESKWFHRNELNILCAVTETGFIVEVRSAETENCNSTESIVTTTTTVVDEESNYGIAIWTEGYEKSKDPNHLNICTLQKHKENYRTVILPLLSFWPELITIRINNYSDREVTPLTLDQIKSQLYYVQRNKRKWHNIKHLTYFCRYGPVYESKRTKYVSDFKWSEMKINAGLTKIRKRISSFTGNNINNSSENSN